jgi:hypothetical protein
LVTEAGLSNDTLDAFFDGLFKQIYICPCPTVERGF